MRRRAVRPVTRSTRSWSGRPFQEIAKKYKGDAKAVATLSEKVRKGGSGVWGPVPMPPNGSDKISDADLKSVVEWILTK